jgi:hypothetical protein
MPALHDSVTYCEPCDWYIAVIEVWSCFECDKPICPGCAIATSDPDASVCTFACLHAYHKRIREQDSPEAA